MRIDEATEIVKKLSLEKKVILLKMIKTMLDKSQHTAISPDTTADQTQNHEPSAPHQVSRTSAKK